MNHDFFISIDWGTSNLRIRFIETDTLKIVEEIESPNGIKEVYALWLKEGRYRESFYTNFIKAEIQKLATALSSSIPIVISGMASSSIGLKELPYAEIPFKTDGSSLFVEQIDEQILLISGVKSSTDVIRGEEIQLLGLSHLSIKSKQNIFILPGTHSKHIVCENEEVVDFKTFMTGELFEVVSQHTILKNSIEYGELTKNEISAFENGVKEAQNGVSLLNSLFKIRTNSLFDKMDAVQNYYFLSGLLIGEELKSIQTDSKTVLHLCAGGTLFELYNIAIRVLKLQEITQIISKEIVDSAVIRGQYKLLKTLK